MWCDGLETEADFVTACRKEPERIAAGYAPFWRYLELGKYGEQFEHLLRVFAREQVHVLRYKDLVDKQAKSIRLDLRVPRGHAGHGRFHPHSNPSGWADAGAVNAMLRATVRGGAAAGALLPPRVWRRAHAPLIRALRRNETDRPHLQVEQRRELVGHFREDIGLLEQLLGQPYSRWLSDFGTRHVRRPQVMSPVDA